MLGSRFDLAETLVEIAQRDAVSSPPEAAERDARLGDHCPELEQQIAEVARRLHGADPRTRFSCPICDTRMHLGAGRIMSEFAALGVEQHHLECDTCGLTTMRAFHAAHGYREIER